MALFLLAADGAWCAPAPVEQLLTRRVTDFAAEYFQFPARDLQVELVRVPEIPAGHLQDSPIEIDIQGSRMTLGYRIFWVTVKPAGARKQRFSVAAHIRVAAMVFVTAERIHRGERLDIQSLQSERRFVEIHPAELPTADQLLAGRTARTLIAPQTVLHNALLAPLQMVHRGDDVRIHLASGGLRIEVQGVARQDGAIGDEISVRFSGSRKTLAGIVQPDGTIEIR